ncbi:hypothetical protein BDV96DRAFT_153709 [Lophiotrema nucula]|uniref:G-patch domain-containing protein n=1 Tax=Lophiotrema nucula TaxID=690887 RepID=A0A6A5Z2J7_9PLEO|nr:hypothetical protein BDV96DRAFT_153709 [Lophiotrema nucula]
MPGRRIVEVPPVRASGRQRKATAKADNLLSSGTSGFPRLKLILKEPEVAEEPVQADLEIENSTGPVLLVADTVVRRSGRLRKPTARALGLWNGNTTLGPDPPGDYTPSPTNKPTGRTSVSKKVTIKTPGHAGNARDVSEPLAVDPTIDVPATSHAKFPNLVNWKPSPRSQPSLNEDASSSSSLAPRRLNFPDLTDRVIQTPDIDLEPPQSVSKPRRPTKRQQASRKKATSLSSSHGTHSVSFPNLKNRTVHVDSSEDSTHHSSARPEHGLPSTSIDTPGPINRNDGHSFVEQEGIAEGFVRVRQWKRRAEDYVFVFGKYSGKRIDEIDAEYARILVKDHELVQSHQHLEEALLWRIRMDQRQLLPANPLFDMREEQHYVVVQFPPCQCTLHQKPHQVFVTTEDNVQWIIDEMPRDVARTFYASLLKRPFKDCMEQLTALHVVQLNKSFKDECRKKSLALKYGRTPAAGAPAAPRTQQRSINHPGCQCELMRGHSEGYVFSSGEYSGVPIDDVPLAQVEKFHQYLELIDHHCGLKQALAQRMLREYRSTPVPPEDVITPSSALVKAPRGPPQEVIAPDKQCRCDRLGPAQGYVFRWGDFKGKTIDQIPTDYAMLYHYSIHWIPHQCGLKSALSHRLEGIDVPKIFPWALGIDPVTTARDRSISPTPSLVDDNSDDEASDEDVPDEEMSDEILNDEDAHDDEDSSVEAGMFEEEAYDDEEIEREVDCDSASEEDGSEDEMFYDARSSRPPETFAQRMLDKWGHIEGQGLGLRSTGITQRLALPGQSSDCKDGLDYSEGLQGGFNRGCFACGRHCHHRDLYMHHFVPGELISTMVLGPTVGVEAQSVQRRPESDRVLGKRPRTENNIDVSLKRPRLDADTAADSMQLPSNAQDYSFDIQLRGPQFPHRSPMQSYAAVMTARA